MKPWRSPGAIYAIAFKRMERICSGNVERFCAFACLPVSTSLSGATNATLNSDFIMNFI